MGAANIDFTLNEERLILEIIQHTYTKNAL